jgi:deoxyribodipyrimidine photo-lyase
VTADLFDDPGGGADRDPFPPTPQAARARIAAVRPADYARTRNRLDGAVTRLSPYVTHGFVTLPEVLQGVRARHAVDDEHKLVQELGWREYFHHVWSHLGDGILQSLHPGPLPDGAYAPALPSDIRGGHTGVPVVDQAVRELYATGWLHNHARMWLASYVVHVRKVQWRAGADWLFGHLLDGDLASNHLSWQWVAGTGSTKPYLFNADNVAKYAPPSWHSPGTAIDTGYEMLDRIARAPLAVPGGTAEAAGIAEPPLAGAGPDGSTPPRPAAVAGRDVWLVHPWCLRDPPPGLAPGTRRVGIVLAPWHARWPWSPRRWRFVGERMRALCDEMWAGDADDLRAALDAAASVRGIDDPHLAGALAPLRLASPPRLLRWPALRCASFSRFWRRATQADDPSGASRRRDDVQPRPRGGG